MGRINTRSTGTLLEAFNSTYDDRPSDEIKSMEG